MAAMSRAIPTIPRWKRRRNKPVAAGAGVPGNTGIWSITRESLRDGTMLARARARVGADVAVRSDAELEASMEAMLAAHPPGEDVWVFGYGSLMWNPAFHFAERRTGALHGWHRRFCLSMPFARGTPERPGLMLALDRGGACRGIAFRIRAADLREELLLVWRREMLGGAYLARWVKLRTQDGPVRAVTFVVNRAFPRYAPALTEAEVAERIATAQGELGSCAEYFEQTVEHLHALGLRDAGLERIRRDMERRAAPMSAAGRLG